MRIEIHILPGEEVLNRLDALSKKLGLVLEKQEAIMTIMDDLNAAVARNSTVEDSVIALLQGISAQLKDALASGDPAAITAVITQLDANTQKLTDAVTANTPPVTPPATPPSS